MMKNFLVRFFAVVFIQLLCYSFLDAQNSTVGARSAAMGNASVPFSDIWSSYNNQSGLAWLEKMEVGAFYENRFLLSELSSQGLAFAAPVKKVGTLGFNFNRFGYTQYHENKFGFAYARKFGPIFSAGIQINLHWIHIGQGYGDLVTASGELSFQVRPMPKWVIAAHVFNPTRTPLASYNRENITTVFRLGTSYLFSDKLLVSVEASTDIEFNPTVRAGIEYHTAQPLYLRIGFNSNPVSPTFGFGLQLKNFRMDAAAGWQPVLGFSPQASLSYRIGK